MNCLQCQGETSNPKFCSRSCAVTFNNRVPKRKAKPKFKKERIKKEPIKTPNERVISYRQRVKAKGIEYLGGCCTVCGYNKCNAALEFHHTDPSQKDFSISAGIHAWEKVKLELDKCALLCSNCHRELHNS